MGSQNETTSSQSKGSLIGLASLVLFLIVVLALVFFLFHHTQVTAVEGGRLIVYKDYYVFSVTTELEDDDLDGTWEVRSRSFSWL